MELREFAQNILNSREMSEKLWVPDCFSDESPHHEFELPMEPARSSRLSLRRWENATKVGFPTRGELLDPTQVGILLHFFANHELLALELMALALLKFPSAPSAFRMGIAHTMRDEQKHLSAYLRRMQELGISFGDIPLNDFFWSQCASMETPLDYVCRMSLTFEQANLDFAAFFRDVLHELNDKVTSELLDQVLFDEMSHVKHGLTWFRRWKPENKSDWQAFCSALGGIVNPARAKGQIFRADYRRDVGFSDDYIDALQVFSQSKGRPPRAVFFNPEAEEDIRANGNARPKLAPVLAVARDDLAPVMLFVAAQTDLVLLPKQLPTGFLKELRGIGFRLPEMHCVPSAENSVLEFLRGRKLSGILPWSVSPFSLRLEKELSLSFDGQSLEPHADLRLIFSKGTALRWLSEFLDENTPDERLIDSASLGCVVRDVSEFDSFLKNARAQGHNIKLIAKRPWSAAGRHRLFFELGDGDWQNQPENVRRWFEKSWRMEEAPIVQPYFKRIVDLSIQARLDADSHGHKTHILGLTRVINTFRGQYAGSCVGRYLSGIESSVVRFFHQKGILEAHNSCGESLEDLMQRIAVWTGEKLFRSGFRGSFGIDAFIFSDSQNHLKLYPMIEINPRHTMGRVAVSLSRRVIPGRVGLWLHVPRSWLEKWNVESFVGLREKWRLDFPLEKHSQSGGVVIARGLLETTPAEQCQQVWTCFLVARDLQADLEKLGLLDLVQISGADLTIDRPEKQL